MVGGRDDARVNVLKNTKPADNNYVSKFGKKGLTEYAPKQ